MKKNLLKTIAISLTITTAVLTSGCTLFNTSGQTINEPDITIDYLQGEYRDQLIRDGAVEITGSAEVIASDDGLRHITIHEKEYVNDDSYPNGFYIANKNKSTQAFLPDEARITFLEGGASEPEILGPDAFLSAYDRENAKYGEDSSYSVTSFYDTKLYTFYLFDDQILLMLARYIP